MGNKTFEILFIYVIEIIFIYVLLYYSRQYIAYYNSIIIFLYKNILLSNKYHQLSTKLYENYLIKKTILLFGHFIVVSN
jgi:hypothetical protein